MTTKQLLEVIRARYIAYDIPLEDSPSVTCPGIDTLFVCAGMQPLCGRFRNPDRKNFGTIQTCVRMNDFDLVGDGIHLTSFKMLGSFGFGTNNYETHIDLWDSILRELDLGPLEVHVHPASSHSPLWYARGYRRVFDNSCEWSDGEIGGYCSEVYWRGLEIGNLVNPDGNSVDVGFGLERLLQACCGAERVDETPEFDQSLDPVSRDLVRTLTIMHTQGIAPSNKLQGYVCRRLLRRFIRLNAGATNLAFQDWFNAESTLVEKALREAKRCYRKHSGKEDAFWWDSFGILPEEMSLVRGAIV